MRLFSTKSESKSEYVTELNPSLLSATKMSSFLLSSLAPNSVAFITSQNEEEELKIAKLSYFSGIASNPPAISVCFPRLPDGNVQTTQLNIYETKEFVVHVVMCDSSFTANQPASLVQEFSSQDAKRAGLTLSPCVKISSPRLTEAPVAFECKFTNIVEVGEGNETSSLVIAEILYVHLADQIYSKEAHNNSDVVPSEPLTKISRDAFEKKFLRLVYNQTQDFMKDKLSSHIYSLLSDANMINNANVREYVSLLERMIGKQEQVPREEIIRIMSNLPEDLTNGLDLPDWMKK